MARNDIEAEINNSLNREVKLHGKIELNVNKSGSFTVGKLCVKGIIGVTRPNVVIDGSDAEIDVQISDCTTSDWSLFFVHPQARNVTFRNLDIKINIKNPAHSGRTFSAIYNTSYGLHVENCNIEIASDKQLNLVGVFNNGNLDTHMDTRADAFTMANSSVRVQCIAEEYEKECATYGIYNRLANSISVMNNFIYAVNKGNGERQKAVGIYTDGRFGRFIGNNIKANGTHNKGFEIEQASAFGFFNEGLYSVITSNNIIAEWAGKCVGLENKGDYAVIENNKILATHTICGRSVRNFANKCNISGNVLTSTSRNARLIEQHAGGCVISRNIMEVLMVPSECQSGCGIYAVGENCANNIITENIIRCVLDCGIFAARTAGTVQNNNIVSYAETVAQTSDDNKYMLDRLDEKYIHSVHLTEE